MRLDNPLLTANGILSKLDEIRVDPSVQAAFKLEDEGQLARLLMIPMVDRLKLYSSKEQRYLDEKAHRLATLRKKLITAYFPGIEPRLILQEIEHLRFTEFPQLQYILRQIFSVATHPKITEIPPELVDWIKPANYLDKHFQDLNSKYGYFSVEVLANATAIFDALNRFVVR